MSTSELQQRWQHSLLDNYGTPPIALVSGQGATVVDADGKTYIDLLAGIAVNSLGHAHPAIVAAVSTQLATLGHTSNLAITRPAVELAEKLLSLAGRSGKVFFCNSGAEANEAAFKLSRRTGRTKVIATDNGFHGRTMGALSLTGQPGKREPFEPLVPGVVFVPYGDVDAALEALDDATAAFFVEAIQGEGGVVAPPAGYLAAVRERAREVGALFIVDEVQTGIGRTGQWFASADLEPDVITLAKGLGGGLPIGACIAFDSSADLLGPGSHGSTFGGNPAVCAAALAVIDVIERDGVLARVREVSDRLIIGLLAEGAPLVTAVRGAGLLLGAELAEPRARELEAAARECGVIVNAVRPDVIRLAPPLLITDAEVDVALESLGKAVSMVTGESEV